MIRELVLGSTNVGKLREYRALLTPLGITVISPETALAGEKVEVIESGDSYQENAWLKARYFATKLSSPTLGEDSGLEVQALDNFPGLASHRWYSGSDGARNQALLAKLGENSARRARFRCIICYLAQPEVEPRYFVGQLEGTLALAPAGEAGFGYDTIFIPDGYNQTLASLGQAVKNQISARSRAITQLIQFLRES